MKSFLMIEPMISLITTFGGLWLLWNGVLDEIHYNVFRILMHLSFVLIVFLLLKELLYKNQEINAK